MRIVDLFSGAGGLTFGFYYNLINGEFVRNRNNEFVFANEYDGHAAKAFELNFPDIKMLTEDIKDVTEESIRELVGSKAVDLIIGGPPCQSFSTVGKRVFDDKAKMYQQYLRVLNIIRPKMFLFENVKGILSMRETFYEMDAGGNIVYENIEYEKDGIIKIKKKPKIIGYGDLIMEKIKEQFAKIDGEFGYDIEPKVLNAVNFGVPQNRERVFIIGIRKGLNINWEFPDGNDSIITLEEAISDLPQVKEGEHITEYNDDANNEYQLLMRGNNKDISEHFCGIYGDKIRTVIKNVEQGQGKNDFNLLVNDGKIDKKYELTSGYANTYGRLIPSIACTTITNNMATPSGLRCIHYKQHRTLTPREGARIQSFPDWFRFEGNKSNVTKQIGNAVPPLLGIAMATQLEKVLGK